MSDFKHLFLYGDRGLHKSTLLSEIASDALKDRSAVGFYVQRIDLCGQRYGFCIRPFEPGKRYETDVEFSPGMQNDAGLFIWLDKNGKHFDARKFTERFIEYTELSHRPDYILMDELGGREFCDEAFREHLYECLDKSRCIGVFKSDDNFKQWETCDDAAEHRGRFKRYIEQSGRLVKVTGHNELQVRDIVKLFLKKGLGE